MRINTNKDIKASNSKENRFYDEITFKIIYTRKIILDISLIKSITILAILLLKLYIRHVY